ncbi:hypothetical protein IQ247_07215 [Plectonema cf. radiosum LEGE 06105]|uniref:Uncharacterized protein n=1 Tax=Plectonema cf. radiosum LEGE 06105 TaxID=945769 RepID=A0A8J7JSG0_9CYAN|nr:hypothetical protein [Plectonema radiosum]MBE9212504.1 hypothetical protein [Plectonema cf. radiosum LEGE 06105]
MKRMRLPLWIPYPNAWLSALMLSVLMSTFLAIVRRYIDSLYNLSKLSNTPEKLSVIVILILILPIPAIALFHHLFLSRLVSSIPGQKTSSASGFVPGLISWWESLYSWLVIVLSTLIAILISTPFLPLFQLNYTKLIATYTDNPSNLRFLFAAVWIISAAILYQIAYLFKARLVSDDSDSDIEDEINSLKTKVKQSEIQNQEVISTTVVSSSDTTKNSSDGSNVAVKERKSSKTFLNIFVISLVGAWLYMFFTLPDVQQSISSGNFAEQIQKRISTETKVVNTQISKISPQSNSFDEALNLANSAAQLQEFASSPEDWNTVLGKWKAALTLMETVPPESANFIVAEQKIGEYKKRLDKAEKKAVKSVNSEQ